MASNILPLFWNLASSSKDARLTASVELISTLEEFQQAHVQAQAEASGSDSESENEEEDDDDDESGVEVDGSDDEADGANGVARASAVRALDARLAKDNAEDVAYTVKRLVRGLASSRESSRFGFSVALTELLERTPTVAPAQVISLIIRSSHTSKAMKGSEERDGLFARLFGLTAVVQSGALWRGDLADFEQLIDALVVLGDKKNWLRESAWWGIVQAAEGLTASQVEWKEEAVQKLTDLLKKGWTQEKLALALLLEKAQPNLDWKDIAYPAIRHTPILSSQNLPTLARILKDSQAAEDDDAPSTSQGSWKPQLHFVWTQIFDALLSPSTVAGQASFQDFFRTVVDESLLANTASPQKRFWGFQVFISALPRVDAGIMPQLFTPNFMRCWMNNLSSSDRYLHKAAQQTASIVQDVAKAHPNVGFALLSRLIGKHGRADFDRATKTKTVERILGSLNEEGVREYVAYLKGVVVKDDESDSTDSKALGDRRKWAIEQLCALVRNAKVPKADDWVSDVLDFLLLHGLFMIKKAEKGSSVAIPKPPLSAGSANTCRERFFAAILDLTTASPSREGEKRREQGRNDAGELWLKRALGVIGQLEKDTKHYEALAEVDGEIVSMRKEAMVLLEKVSSNDKQSADIVKACEILLSYAILQTYEERADMLETLEDVTTAVQAMFAPKAKSKAKANGKSAKGKGKDAHDHDHDHGEDEDAEPIDLLVDTLIALLDKNSGGLRSLATMVLALSAPALTSSTIEHLLAQLDAAPGTVEGPEIDAEELEEDEDEEQEDEEDEDADADSDDDDESEEEESEAEEDDEDMGDVDPAFRKRVEEALRAAGMDPEGDGHEGAEGEDDEDESSDEEIWDDEQMMKVDEHLAKVFRDRKEGNTKQKAKRMVTDNVHFKTRILDLFDTYIRKQSSNPLVLDTVMPLLRLVRRSGDEAVLSTKTAGIIRSRFDKPKEVPTADVAHASAILRDVHNFARRANTNELASAALSCSLFVARSIFQSDPKSTVVPATYAATVNDYMTRKGSLVRVPFMKDYIKRFPVQAWPLRKEVIKFLQQGEGYHPFRQLQMYELVAAFASHLGNIAQSVPAQEVEAFVRDVRVAVYETIRRVASTGADDESTEKGKEGWKTAWLKDVARQGLHVMRQSKLVVTDTKHLKDIWASPELEQLLETVQNGKTSKMTGLIQLVKQLRAVLESEGQKGKKRKAGAEAEKETKGGDVDMDAGDAEAPKAKKGKKAKGDKEKKVKVKA